MARKKRPCGRVWHAMHRGVNGCPIFGDDYDKAYFLSLVADKVPDSKVDIHAFVLMTNHFHFLLSAEVEAMSKFMARLNGTYAFKFNRRWDRYGPLFQGRYHAVPIFAPMRIVEVSCYLHQNPVPAGLSERAADYPWSSYGHYVGESDFTSTWIKPDFVLEVLQRSGPRGIKYSDLMLSYTGDERDLWLREIIREAEAHRLSV